MAKLLFKYIFMHSEYSLDGLDRVDVGRVGKNDIVIPDYHLFKQLSPDSQKVLINDLIKVSRLHARLEKKEDGYWYIEDVGTKGMGSNFGTFVNGSRLEVKRPYLLKNEDKIRFGVIECIFSDKTSL